MLLALVLLVGVPASHLPDYSDYVVDQAGVLGSVDAHLKSVSSKLDHAGIAQIAICTVTEETLGDDSKEDFAADLFRKWGLGHGKKKADGILIFLAAGRGAGHRHIKVEVGYGLEGVLPDGKVGALVDQYAGPSLKHDDYATAAVQLQSAIASVLQADAAAGGDAAPGKDTLRGGKGVGQAGGAPADFGGLIVTVLAMLALVVTLATSGARRQFPGMKTQVAAAGLGGLSVLSLIGAGSGAGWIALVVGLILVAVIWTSIRAHRCPRDGSWMTIDEEVIDPPTYFSQGVAHVTQQCTNRKCGYSKEFDRAIPRKQMTVVTGGGGGGGGGGGDGFSGGGGGDSGGGGAGRDY